MLRLKLVKHVGVQSHACSVRANKNSKAGSYEPEHLPQHLAPSLILTQTSQFNLLIAKTIIVTLIYVMPLKRLEVA